MYVYNADLYCDDCGEGIAAHLFERGAEDTGDSDAYPQSTIESESDSPNHCACGAECHNRVDLTAYGLTEEDRRETGAPRYVGALIEEDLTEDGVAYAREMIEDGDASPYQRALHRFWRESYPAVMDAAEEAAHARGREDGVAAGTWILDGNSTEEAARALLAGIEDGDPAVLDALPSAPLSGEFADGLLPRDVLAWYGLTEEDAESDDILSAYEDGYADGVQEEAERSARAMLAD